MFLVQLDNTDPVYKSDGFRRVHVTREERDALLAAGVKLTVVKTAKALAAFGPEVTA
jgi:sulfopyruvate decarboxylase TPP-binding subunit